MTGLPASKTVKDKCLLFKPPRLWWCVIAPWTKASTEPSKVLWSTVSTLISQHSGYGCHTSPDACLSTGWRNHTKKAYQAQLWGNRTKPFIDGDANTDELIQLFTLPRETESRCVLNFLSWHCVTFFSIMADKIGYRNGLPFPETQNTLLLLSESKVSSPNNTFPNEKQEPDDKQPVCPSPYCLLFLCSCSNSYLVDQMFECQSGRHSRKISRLFFFLIVILFGSCFCFKTKRKYSNDTELTEKCRCLQFIFLDCILIEFA